MAATSHRRQGAMTTKDETPPSIEERRSISMLERWGLRVPTTSELSDATADVAEAVEQIEYLQLNLRTARELSDGGDPVSVSTAEFGAISLAAKSLVRQGADLREWANTIEDVAEDLVLATEGRAS